MRRAKWMLMAALLHSLAASSWAGEQGFRRWWGIGYGDGYHACHRCCGSLHYPYATVPDFGPYVPLPATEAVPVPQAVGPSARQPDAERFSPWARLPLRSGGGPRISR